MDIQKEREVLIAEIEKFKEEAMKSYVVSRWAESYVNTDPFGYVFIEGNKPWWMKTQAHQLWCFWQSSKAEIGLRWIDINERVPEQGQKVLIYRPFAHEKPHGDPNIKMRDETKQVTTIFTNKAFLKLKLMGFAPLKFHSALDQFPRNPQ